jgi:hypothetical protein
VVALESTPASADAGAFTLPGGYVDGQGVLHRRGLMRAPTGRDERWLQSLPASSPQALVVTELLRRCVRRIGPHRASREMMCELGVGDRDYLLLQMRRAVAGSHWPMLLECPEPSCAERMDLDLVIDQVPVQEGSAGASVRVALPLAEVEARLPNGGDQEASARDQGDPATLSDRLLERCVLRVSPLQADGPCSTGALTASERAQIAAAIEQVMPGVALELEAACPECRRTFSVPFDVAGLVLDELRSRAASFERELHLLAFYYHWPLRELLGLTRAQRQRFVGLIEQQLEARS